MLNGNPSAIGLKSQIRVAVRKVARSNYTDISDILRMKEEVRREIAKLSLEDKLQMLEVMRDRVAPLKSSREDPSDQRNPARADSDL